jgi:4-amino-4-deoxy-L-arabinose transferase-like glycosyltransferase
LVVPTLMTGWAVLRSAEGRAILWRLRLGWGAPLMLAIVLPWAVAVNSATDGAFLREAVGTHVVGRSMSSFEGHGFFPGFYLVTAVLVAFPWVSMLVEALGSRGRRLFEELELRYLVAWLVGPLLLLEMVQTKLVHYWMPSYPAGVLLVLGWAAAARRQGWAAGVSTRWIAGLGGMVLAVIPLGMTAYLGTANLLGVGILGFSVLAPAVVGGVLLMRRRAVPGLVILAVGSLAYLVVIAAAYVPRFGDELLAPRAARRAVELRQPGETIVVFKPRDDDIYFYLPVEADTCRGAGCMEQLYGARGRLLAIARERDFELLIEEWPSVALRKIDQVDGIDVGHLRADRLILFRPFERGRAEGILTPIGDAS